MVNNKFVYMLEKMRGIHDRKSNDYASSEDRYSNFRLSGMIAAKFTDPVDIAFAVMIGTKLARLAELRGKGKTPQNESVQDTHDDLAVYATLWASYYAEPSSESQRPAQVQSAPEGQKNGSAKTAHPYLQSGAQGPLPGLLQLDPIGQGSLQTSISPGHDASRLPPEMSRPIRNGHPASVTRPDDVAS